MRAILSFNGLSTFSVFLSSLILEGLLKGLFLADFQYQQNHTMWSSNLFSASFVFQVFPDQGFPESESRVRVKVLEVSSSENKLSYLTKDLKITYE